MSRPVLFFLKKEPKTLALRGYKNEKASQSYAFWFFFWKKNNLARGEKRMHTLLLWSTAWKSNQSYAFWFFFWKKNIVVLESVQRLLFLWLFNVLGLLMGLVDCISNFRHL
jgi:hypothetical protein